MSWDLLVMDLPAEAESIEDIPYDFKPRLIGKRADVIEKMKAVVPFADFADLSWGRIDGDGFSIEVNLGEEEELISFALHVRGGDGAVGVIVLLISHLGLRAIDSSTGDFFDPETALGSLRNWRTFRDQVIASLRGDQQL